MKLLDKTGAAQDLDLQESQFVAERGRVRVSCSRPGLDAPATDAAFAFLGMAPEARLGPQSCPKGPPPAVLEDRETGAIRMVHREIRLRFMSDVSAKKRQEIFAHFALTPVPRSGGKSETRCTVKSTRPAVHGAELIHLTNQLQGCDEVIWATPNFVSSYERQMPALPVAPGPAWHLDSIDAPEAWALSLGRRTVVAIIDDGVDIEHRNLVSRIKFKPDRTEPRDRFGRDFFLPVDHPDHFNPRPKVFSLPSHLVAGNDLHGTACAGIVAASGLAVAGTMPAVGVAPKARLLPVKVFHASRFVPDENVAAAIRYASRCADVLSCSWTAARGAEVTDAFEEASTLGRRGRGCPVIVATGNFGATVAYPASLSATIAVSSITEQETAPAYTNRGPEVDVCAPSSGGPRSVYTTDWSLPGRGLNAAVDLGGSHTNAFEGTSASCPQVAGVVALMLARRSSLTAEAVREILRASAATVGGVYAGPAETHAVFGHGRVNALRAVQAAIAA